MLIDDHEQERKHTSEKLSPAFADFAPLRTLYMWLASLFANSPTASPILLDLPGLLAAEVAPSPFEGTISETFRCLQ